MAKKVLDEMPKEETKSKAKKTVPSKEEATEALEAVEKEEKEARLDACDKKCGFKKFILPTVIVLVVAAIGCLCFFGYRMVFGDNPVKITSKAIRGLKESIKDAKDDSDGIYELISGDDAYEISSNTELSLPSGMGKYTIDMLLQADSKNKAGKLDLKAKQNKTEMMNLSAVLDSSKLYFKLADSMKNYYFVDIEKTLNEITKSVADLESQIDLEALALLQNYDFTKLLDYAADAIDGALSKDDFKKSKEEITVKGKDVKATKYTAKIDQKTLIKIAKEFAKKAKDDKDLVKLIATLADVKEKEVVQLFEKLIDTEPENVEDGYVLYSVYVSSLGKTLGYGFEIENLGSVIITNKGDVTTISLKAKDFFGSIEINEKDDDHVIITVNVMGMANAELDIKSDTDTVKKNKEYKQTLDVKITVSVMGQSLNASIKNTSTIKKIDEVDTTGIKNAINIEKMSDYETKNFERELEKSSFYQLIKGLSGMMPSSGSEPVEYVNESYTKDDAARNAFADEALNYAKAAETKYVADSLDNKAKECYTLKELDGFISNSNNYTGKVRLLTNSTGEITAKYVSLSDNKKYMILDYNTKYLDEYSVYDFSNTLWGSTYTTCE